MLYLTISLLAIALVAFGIIGAIAWRLMVWMPGRSYRGEIALDENELGLREKLRCDLTVLADEIGERHLSGRYEQLTQAVEFIEQQLAGYGYEPRRQEFEVNGKAVWNVEAELPGDELASEIIVVGAHYDTIAGSPGANDNGSAVVANLAIAEAFANLKPRRTVRFAFFVNEESPYHMTRDMGALRCAESCRDRGENVVGMIALETIGYYSSEPGSQRYPAKFLSRLYPTTGDYLAVVGNVASRRWLHEILAGLRRSEFPTEGMAAPRLLKDTFRSDHAAFWHCGYPALMITDTANFRYPHYHTAMDTVDKINFDALARVVTALTVSLRQAAGAA